MSTEYFTEPKITLDKLRSNLPEGITIKQRAPVYICACACLTDGKNYVWAFQPDLHWIARNYPDQQPDVEQVVFERFGVNHVGPIFEKLKAAFGLTFKDAHGLEPLPED